MLVRRPDVTILTRRPGDLTSEPQHFKEEETDPAWAFAQLGGLGFSLVTVSHANLVGLIRIPRPPTHVVERYRTTVLAASLWALSRGASSRRFRKWPFGEIGAAMAALRLSSL
jgi:hypothetical protein